MLNCPICGKEIPEGNKACSEECVKKALELRKQKRNRNFTSTGNLTSEETLWMGQDRRKRATETILKLAKELLPMPFKKFASTVSFRTGLSLRKIMDDYLEVLLEIGLLKRLDNMLYLEEKPTEVE